MSSTEKVKTIIQCDFDGTITEEDVGFMLLDNFTNGEWQQTLAEYKAGDIPVGQFNSKAFNLVKTNKPTLVEFVKKNKKVQAGFQELLNFCHWQDIKFVIVSNGLDFYIETILKSIGKDDIEVMASKTYFGPDGIEPQYIGPEGNQLQDGFKEAYARLFLDRGYRVIYVGNGFSDIPPAKLAYHTFARGELLDYCRQANLNHTPFDDLNDVVRGLERL